MLKINNITSFSMIFKFWFQYRFMNLKLHKIQCIKHEDLSFAYSWRFLDSFDIIERGHSAKKRIYPEDVRRDFTKI